MRYFKIPEPIQLVNPDTDEVLEQDPMTFWDFVRKNILVDTERFGAGYDALVSVLQIKDELSKAAPGTVASLDEGAWKNMCEIIDKPSGKWPAPILAIQLLPFMDVVKEASKNKPE